MSLFDDRAEDAAITVATSDGSWIIPYLNDRREGGRDTVRDHVAAILNAALAALPREELIEKAARAMSEGRDFWDDLDEHTRDLYRSDADASLVAIGLIPEHVTATEER